MTQPYRLNEPSGIKIEATGEIIQPGDPGWQAYIDWLATQPGAATPGGPTPPGTGVLPYVPYVPPLEDQRLEATLRVAGAASTRATFGTVEAVGHMWNLSPPFLLAVLVHRMVMPPVPVDFALPDATYAQVSLNQAEFDALCHAISDRTLLVNARMAELLNTVQVSGAPLDIDFGEGWPA
jgi:hypothetical protein